MKVHPEQLTSDYYFPNTIPEEMRPLFASCAYVWQVLKKHSVLFAKLQKTYIASGAKIHSSVEIIGPVHVGSGTQIEANTRIEGPTIIGDDCRIGHSVHVHPTTFINSHCVVGHGSEVKNSLMLPGAEISSLAFVGDSILGGHARIGSGVITDNRRFDQSEIIIQVDQDQIRTETDLLGCVLGENSHIGVNAITNPGTLVGPRTFVQGLVSLSGFIPANTFVRLRQQLDFEENGHTFPEALK